MAKKAIFITFFVMLGFGYAFSQPSAPQSPSIGTIEPIKKDDRILILAPHPDDEAIGCAGIIQEAVSKGADIKIVYLTNGEHNQIAFIVYEKRLPLRQGEFIHLGEVRRQEAIKAMELLGVNSKNLIFLGYPDFGTFAIFREAWKKGRPYKSILTRISRVPYKDNFSFNAPYKGESVLSDLEKIIKDYKPNKIFVSHPADTNVDHKTFYLFLKVALHDLEKEIPEPKVYSYLIHCVGWPLPRHYHPELRLEPPKQFLDVGIDWSQLQLTPEQINKKHEAVLCYKSQTQSSAFYLLAFVRKNELFGDFPDIELDRMQELKEKVASFLGYSNMFADSNPETVAEDLDSLNKNKGRVDYSLKDNNLLIHIYKPKNLNNRFGVQLYLFGYSDKTPFALMPKIRIITKYKKIRLFDGKKMINPEGMDLEFGPKEATLKVPLKILGEPDFILAAVKTFTGVLHADTTGFREISIK